jgi:gas vesicle protein
MSHMFRRSYSGAGWSKGFLGFMAGVAATYYLFGTDSGKAKRRQLAKYAANMKDKVMDAKDTVVEYADEKKEDVSELADRMKGHLKEMKDDITDTLG